MPTQAVRISPDLDPIETDTIEELDAAVLAHLRATANPAGIAAASKRSLAAELGLSPATAQRSLNRIADAGQIDLVTRGTGGRYRSRFRVHAVAKSTTAA